MHEANPIYAVAVEARLPEFESERLFVINEKQYAHKELEQLESKHPAVKAARAVTHPVTGALKPQDWKHYLHALDRYWDKMGDHMQEIADGLVPLKFFVVNTGSELDEAIKIKVHVQYGVIHPKKAGPERPVRIDGAQHVSNWSPRAPLVGGFSRSKIKITPHSIEATFSQLQAQDSADLVHQIVYVKGDERTRFTYEIGSKRLGVVERGEVGFI
jgi:hypothetical protein